MPPTNRSLPSALANGSPSPTQRNLERAIAHAVMKDREMHSVIETDGAVQPFWYQEIGDSPIVAVAVHNGHDIRAEVAPFIALEDEVRLREEDPYTGEWTKVAPTRLVALRSRFEVDLNRPRETAVYGGPDDAWGLAVWREDLDDAIRERSLAEYDAFYATLHRILSDIEQRWGTFVVLDLHSYNHRREGPHGPTAAPDTNPQVNIGTGSMDRELWGGLVDRFIGDLTRFDFPDGRLDVRENVKFLGRHVAQYVHQHFPATGCALAIELKKFFMDEWTGTVDDTMFCAIHEALESTTPGLLEELDVRRDLVRAIS